MINVAGTLLSADNRVASFDDWWSVTVSTIELPVPTTVEGGDYARISSSVNHRKKCLNLDRPDGKETKVVMQRTTSNHDVGQVKRS